MIHAVTIRYTDCAEWSCLIRKYNNSLPFIHDSQYGRRHIALTQVQKETRFPLLNSFVIFETFYLFFFKKQILRAIFGFSMRTNMPGIGSAVTAPVILRKYHQLWPVTAGYLKTLATCYWFGINTIQIAVSTSQMVLECYFLVGG